MCIRKYEQLHHLNDEYHLVPVKHVHLLHKDDLIQFRLTIYRPLASWE